MYLYVFFYLSRTVQSVLLECVSGSVVVLREYIGCSLPFTDSSECVVRV